MSARITIDEVLDEVHRLHSDKINGEAHSTEEWSDIWGFGICKTRQLIRAAIRSGKMRSRQVIRPNDLREGWHSRYVVYEFLEKK